MCDIIHAIGESMRNSLLRRLIALGIIAGGISAGIGTFAHGVDVINNTEKSRKDVESALVLLKTSEEIQKAKTEYISKSAYDYETGEKTLREFDMDLDYVQSEQFFVETLKKNPERYETYESLLKELEKIERKEDFQSVLTGTMTGVLLASAGITAFGVKKFSQEKKSL